MTIAWGAEIVAVDVETTGLSVARGDRVIEVGVVRGRLGAEPRRWSTLLDPERPVGATHVHGLTDDDVAGQRRFPDVAADVARWLDGAVLVAHNAPFDLGFLDMEFRRCGGSRPLGPVIDTLGLARRHLALPSNALGALCDRFGIVRHQAHRALADAEATWRLAWRLLDTIDPDRAASVDDLMRGCRRRTPDERRDVHRALLDAWRSNGPIWIDYLAADRPELPRTRRAITVRQVFAGRVVAWCHLREAERTFRLDRLTLV